MLTFDQFVKTKTFSSDIVRDLGTLGTDPGEPVAGFIYMNQYYITINPDKYHEEKRWELVTSDWSMTDTLDNLERELYNLVSS